MSLFIFGVAVSVVIFSLTMLVKATLEGDMPRVWLWVLLSMWNIVNVINAWGLIK